MCLVCGCIGMRREGAEGGEGVLVPPPLQEGGEGGASASPPAGRWGGGGGEGVLVPPLLQEG